MRKQSKWSVFISGRGSNLQALLDLQGEISIGLVVSSRADAPGLKRARRAGVSSLVLEKNIDWQALDNTLRQRGITDIFLAGFMRIVPESFIRSWQGRIYNLHPSLLPSYPGLKSIEKSYADQAAMGVSFHHVVPEVDAGEILKQSQVFCGGETKDRGLTLSEAELLIHVREHKIVREAVGCLSWK